MMMYKSSKKQESYSQGKLFKQGRGTPAALMLFSLFALSQATEDGQRLVGPDHQQPPPGPRGYALKASRRRAGSRRRLGPGSQPGETTQPVEYTAEAAWERPFKYTTGLTDHNLRRAEWHKRFGMRLDYKLDQSSTQPTRTTRSSTTSSTTSNSNPDRHPKRRNDKPPMVTVKSLKKELKKAGIPEEEIHVPTGQTYLKQIQASKNRASKRRNKLNPAELASLCHSLWKLEQLLDKAKKHKPEHRPSVRRQARRRTRSRTCNTMESRNFKEPGPSTSGRLELEPDRRTTYEKVNAGYAKEDAWRLKIAEEIQKINQRAEYEEPDKQEAASKKGFA